MSNAIPTSSRETVKQRDNHQCQRCGVRGSDWHHRRRRAVKTHFQHCPCNGVWLCRTCHNWVHAHPREAMEDGFIVSAYHDEPCQVGIKTFSGWTFFHCDGSVRYGEA